MRHSLPAVFALAALALALPAGADAQRVRGVVTVGPSGGEPGTVTTSRAPARGLPDEGLEGSRVPALPARAASSVTLVLVPSLPPDADGASAVIMRRASTNPQNVILVTSATTAADLTTAVAALFNSRRKQGDAIDRDLLALVAPAAVPAANAPPAEVTDARQLAAWDSTSARRPHQAPKSRSVAEAERQLAMLRTAPSVDVAGVGTYPARVVKLGRLRQ